MIEEENMDFMELALRRESCRDFSEKPVEKEKLEAVMQAARLAPSACNSQPWSFTAVTGARTAKAVAKCLQGMGGAQGDEPMVAHTVNQPGSQLR